MKNICRDYIESHDNRVTPWTRNEQASRLVRYIYEGTLWDSRYREKIRSILDKDIDDLTVPEIGTYLTFIVATDRTNDGCIDAHIENGTVLKLLTRYLELMEAAES